MPKHLDVFPMLRVPTGIFPVQNGRHTIIILIGQYVPRRQIN